MAAATPVPPVFCKQQLVLVHATKPPLPLLARRAVSVRAAPPRQRQQRPPPRTKRVDPPPRPARRPPRAPLDYDDDDEEEEEEGRFAGGTRAASMPKPPAGFVLDDKGRCIAAASKRIVTIIDDANNRPLECIIRRVFRSSQDHDCMLLCPVDMPVQVLKSTNFSGWIAVDDHQLKQIIPSVAYALARVHMHFVESGILLSVSDSVIQQGVAFAFLKKPFKSFMIADSGDGVEGVPFEGVEICCFNLDGAHYMIYTPVDPLLFVAVKDKDGVLRIAEDDLMDDPAVVDAIDEETEFTALVEEEEALLETVLGER
ncbi:uncharacterized protein LOC120683235 isoform X2 [Panicum virgatum]|uniref:Uncharacterized protein n=1 Tax=Panicum virgatum TaxID=38727 RepID=A0A8T0Q7R5_PANVG|nr:uncharacterized protein LOC120683235 isoform X2 [Panicum virgatum]KAG2570013.1 hypothetical protein PVAP13_7NG414800 [Panicum virgatum]